nr:hypothetical protein [Tanacetum cinerariifolium]
LDGQRQRLMGQIGKDVNNTLLYVYRDLSDGELDEFATFAESNEGKAYYKAALASVRAGLARYRNSLPPAVFEALVNNSNQRFASQAMDQRAEQMLRQTLPDPNPALQFFQTPLGRKIVNAELTATRPDQLAKNAQGLPHIQADDNRLLIIGHLANALPAKEAGAEWNRLQTGKGLFEHPPSFSMLTQAFPVEAGPTFVMSAGKRPLRALAHPLRQELKEPRPQLRRLVCQIVFPVHGHVRLALHDERAAAAARRAFDPFDPLGQRPHPDCWQASGLQGVRQQERQKCRRVGVFAETPVDPFDEGAQQVIAELRQCPAAWPHQRRKQDRLPLRRAVVAMMKQMVDDNCPAGTLPAQVPWLGQLQGFGFDEQAIQYRLILREIGNACPRSAGQTMARQVAAFTSSSHCCKQPVRDGQMSLKGLQAPVTVRYDERGVPHIRAANQDDLYRALGYVHAQDRLFQMEILRRLARGELAEVLGPKLINTDKLFRSLRIREHADAYVARQDQNTPAWKALQAYLDGINQFQATHPKPVEFDVLGIRERPFTAQDTLSVGGYLAYSFAAAFRTEPLMTYVRNQLGPDYLKIFDLEWQPQGALGQSPALTSNDWKNLDDLALLSQQALEKAGLPQFEGSNAWAVSGSRTQSGKPLLAGDPHIRFSVPAGFYEANRADTLAKMRGAAEKIQSPGLNIVYANAKGDIGWWAAAQLPKRPAGVDPAFILDGSSEQADKNGFYPFSANPQEENPARGYIVSANFQPVSPTGMEIPGYYNLPERGRQLDRQLSDDKVRWNLENSQALQLGIRTDYAAQILEPLIPVLRRVVSEPEEHDLLERLAAWEGDYSVDSVGATLFNQFLFNLADQTFHDELGDGLFNTLLSTRLIDSALPRLAADPNSPWWNNRHSREPESRDNTVKVAWHAAVSHLKSLYGQNPDEWTWGKAHTLTHEHPLGKQPPLDMLFNVGPFAAPGTHEVPNNLSASAALHKRRVRARAVQRRRCRGQQQRGVGAGAMTPGRTVEVGFSGEAEIAPINGKHQARRSRLAGELHQTP